MTTNQHPSATFKWRGRLLFLSPLAGVAFLLGAATGPQPFVFAAATVSGSKAGPPESERIGGDRPFHQLLSDQLGVADERKSGETLGVVGGGHGPHINPDIDINISTDITDNSSIRGVGNAIFEPSKGQGQFLRGNGYDNLESKEEEEDTDWTIKDESDFLGEFLEEVVEDDETMFLEHNQWSDDHDQNHSSDFLHDVAQFEDESALQHKYKLRLFDNKVSSQTGTYTGIDIYVVKNSDFDSPNRVYQKKLSYSSIIYPNNACCTKSASKWRSGFWWCDGKLFASDEGYSVVLCANGIDLLFIDRMEMRKSCNTGCTTAQSWGAHGGSGYCLSTDSSNNFGGKCSRSYTCIQFKMDGGVYGVSRPINADGNQNTGCNADHSSCQSSIGGSCYSWKPCCSGNTCHSGNPIARTNKCYHHPRSQGEPCNNNFPCDTSKYYCDPTGFCKTLKTHGQGCLYVKCASGLECAGIPLKCRNDPRTAGEPCSAFEPCASGLECAGLPLKCRHNPREDGEPCSTFEPCADNLFCKWTFDKTIMECGGPAGEGEACGPTVGCEEDLYCNLFRCSRDDPCITEGHNEQIQALQYQEQKKEAKVIATRTALESALAHQVAVMSGTISLEMINGVDGVVVQLDTVYAPHFSGMYHAFSNEAWETYFGNGVSAPMDINIKQCRNGVEVYSGKISAFPPTSSHGYLGRRGPERWFSGCAAADDWQENDVIVRDTEECPIKAYYSQSATYCVQNVDINVDDVNTEICNLPEQNDYCSTESTASFYAEVCTENATQAEVDIHHLQQELADYELELVEILNEMETLEAEIAEQAGIFGWRDLCNDIHGPWLAGWSLADAVLAFLDEAKCVLLKVALFLVGKVIDYAIKAYSGGGPMFACLESVCTPVFNLSEFSLQVPGLLITGTLVAKIVEGLVCQLPKIEASLEPFQVVCDEIALVEQIAKALINGLCGNFGSALIAILEPFIICNSWDCGDSYNINCVCPFDFRQCSLSEASETKLFEIGPPVKLH